MEPMWKPKVGDPFPLRLMSDEHLNNAILMLRRFGYITTAEAGDMPDDPDEAVVWASKPASMLLDSLATERLARIETGQAPFSEEQAAAEQAQWRIRQQEAERARPAWNTAARRYKHPDSRVPYYLRDHDNIVPRGYMQYHEPDYR